MENAVHAGTSDISMLSDFRPMSMRPGVVEEVDREGPLNEAEMAHSL